MKTSHFDLIKLVHHPHFALLDKQHLIQLELGTQLKGRSKCSLVSVIGRVVKAALTGKLPGPLFQNTKAISPLRFVLKNGKLTDGGSGANNGAGRKLAPPNYNLHWAWDEFQEAKRGKVDCWTLLSHVQIGAVPCRHFATVCGWLRNGRPLMSDKSLIGNRHLQV